jgi:hypothetical protein
MSEMFKVGILNELDTEILTFSTWLGTLNSWRSADSQINREGDKHEVSVYEKPRNRRYNGYINLRISRC